MNFEVPISNNLQLGLSSGNSGLYRNDQGSFLIHIILVQSCQSLVQVSQPGYYYFYYNIELDIPCEYNITSLENFNNNKNLLRIVDILGREVVTPNSNNTYFYIYDDGSVIKKVIIK